MVGRPLLHPAQQVLEASRSRESVCPPRCSSSAATSYIIILCSRWSLLRLYIKAGGPRLTQEEDDNLLCILLCILLCSGRECFPRSGTPVTLPKEPPTPRCSAWRGLPGALSTAGQWKEWHATCACGHHDDCISLSCCAVQPILLTAVPLTSLPSLPIHNLHPRLAPVFFSFWLC